MGRKPDNDWKARLGVVYSTSDEFDYSYDKNQESDTLPNNQQKLRIQLDKKQRAGKKVILVTGFVGTEEDLKSLAKMLKTKCGVGGGTKNGEILIQGDFIDRVREILGKEGYKTN